MTAPRSEVLGNRPICTMLGASRFAELESGAVRRFLHLKGIVFKDLGGFGIDGQDGLALVLKGDIARADVVDPCIQ